MPVAWRIVKRRHASTAFSGEGARLFGGRWNYPGTALVYLAESQSLAALEMLVHLDGAELLSGYVTIRAQFDEALVEVLPLDVLPPNWHLDTTTAPIRDLGEQWAASGRTPVLRVPSVIIPGESNYLLNPRHPAMTQVSLGAPVPFRFDRRLTLEI